MEQVNMGKNDLPQNGGRFFFLFISRKNREHFVVDKGIFSMVHVRYTLSYM